MLSARFAAAGIDVAHSFIQAWHASMRGMCYSRGCGVMTTSSCQAQICPAAAHIPWILPSFRPFPFEFSLLSMHYQLLQCEQLPGARFGKQASCKQLSVMRLDSTIWRSAVLQGALVEFWLCFQMSWCCSADVCHALQGYAIHSLLLTPRMLHQAT